MQAGKYKRRIKLQKKTETADAKGVTVATWTDYVSVWARADTARGGKRARESEIAVTEGRVDWIIRYRNDVTADMRVVYGTHKYEIESIENPGEQNRELVLFCVEKT